MTKSTPEWMLTGTRVVFTVTPTLGTDDGGEIFCRWHNDAETLRAWGRANLKGEHLFMLGREDAEHFNHKRIEFVFYGDAADAALVHETWGKS